MKYIAYTFIFASLVLIIGCKPNPRDKQKNRAETISTENDSSFYMRVDSDTLSIEEKEIGLTLFNNSSQYATYGSHLKLDIYEDSTWVEILPAPNIVFNDMAYHLYGRGSSHYKHFMSSIYTLRPGKYRISNNIRITLEKDFYVTKDTTSKKENFKRKKNTIEIVMDNDTIYSETDSISFYINNNINNVVFALEHYFLSYYDEESDSWLDYYNRSYDGSEIRELKPKESTRFTIMPDNPLWFRNKGKSNKKQSFILGKYRIRKYVEIPVSAEFILQ